MCGLAFGGRRRRPGFGMRARCRPDHNISKRSAFVIAFLYSPLVPGCRLDLASVSFPAPLERVPGRSPRASREHKESVAGSGYSHAQPNPAPLDAWQSLTKPRPGRASNLMRRTLATPPFAD